MYPKLKEQFIKIFLKNGSVLNVTTKALVAAYAGSTTTKELLLIERNPLTKGSYSFEEKYNTNLTRSIQSVNQLGLSTTFDTIEAFHPARGIDILLQEQQDNAKNKYWPFFNED